MNTIQKQTLIEIAALIAAVAMTAALSGCSSSPELPPEPSGDTVPVPGLSPRAPIPTGAAAPVAAFSGLSAPRAAARPLAPASAPRAPAPGALPTAPAS